MSAVTLPAESPADRLRSVEELDAAIVSLSRQVNSASYRLLVLVREFDDRLGWSHWSFPCASEWLAWRCGLSLSAAREKLRTAHALRGLPAISAAFADGLLSYSKVRALTRVAQVDDEDLLVDYALNASAAQVEERCRQIRNVAPDSIEVARRAWERRSLSIARNPAAGTMLISIELPVEDGELVAKAVDRAVAAGEGELGPEFDAAGWRAQQADALVAIARDYLAGGPRGGDTEEPAAVSGAATADRYQIVVHVDESALCAGATNSEGAPLRGGVARSDLPLESVRRLTCDGSLVRVIERPDGTPLAIGRRQRVVTGAIRRALWSRDRGCSFPGCERRHYVDAHNIRHWANGGETTLDNLTLLCTQHHRLLHEGRYRIGRDIDGAIYFERRDGRVIPRGGYEAGAVHPSVEGCDDRRPGTVQEARGPYRLLMLAA